MPEQEKDKDKFVAPAPSSVATEPAGSPATVSSAKSATAPEEDMTQHFFGEPLVGFDPSEITGSLIVIEGMDGSGRSTQITLLQEWLESEGFAVQTSGLRRSNLVGRDIDQLLAKNAVTRLTRPIAVALHRRYQARANQRRFTAPRDADDCDQAASSRFHFGFPPLGEMQHRLSTSSTSECVTASASVLAS